MNTSDGVLHMTWMPRPDPWPGIIGKLRQQGAAAIRSGCPIHFLVVSGADLPSSPGLTWLECGGSPGWLLGSRLWRHHWIGGSIPQGTRRCILRHAGTADLSLPWFLQRWGTRIISEHHSDPVSERAARRGSTSARPWDRFADALLPIYLRHIAGAVGVTPEISASLSRAAPGLPTAWCSNGVDCHGTPFRGRRRFAGGDLDIVAALGTEAPWHGLDRLVTGLRSFRGPHRINLRIAGRSHLPDENGPHYSVTNLGQQTPADLDRTLAEAHLGIASLALHRAGLRQACPIKSREYAARGLPFIYAYDDPDLPTGLPGVLQLQGGDDALDPTAIVEFAAALPANAAESLRRFAETRLDWSCKLPEYLRIARSMIP